MTQPLSESTLATILAELTPGGLAALKVFLEEVISKIYPDKQPSEPTFWPLFKESSKESSEKSLKEQQIIEVTSPKVSSTLKQLELPFPKPASDELSKGITKANLTADQLLETLKSYTIEQLQEFVNNNAPDNESEVTICSTCNHCIKIDKCFYYVGDKEAVLGKCQLMNIPLNYYNMYVKKPCIPIG